QRKAELHLGAERVRDGLLEVDTALGDVSGATEVELVASLLLDPEVERRSRGDAAIARPPISLAAVGSDGYLCTTAIAASTIRGHVIPQRSAEQGARQN